MVDEWVPVPGFPKYSINRLGQVRKNSSKHILKPKITQYGTAYVGLMRNRIQHQRSLALLVANTFITEKLEAFDTPINLDGDRFNCAVDNLMWRPRWFAINYHRQFSESLTAPERPPVRERETYQFFPTPMAACIQFGLLESDLIVSIGNRTYVWPTYQMFDWA